MTTHTKLALALAAALTLSACNDGGDSGDGFTALVRSLVDGMSETIDASQALFDRLVASEPETGEPQAL